MTIHQFFILSPRGDTIINKDYRGDAIPSLHETFFRKVHFWDGKGDAPPVFQLEGFTFLYIKRNSLLIVCTTKFNVSPSVTLELLNRLSTVFKDYCGVLTEESIRRNFILIYELLDEMLDFGYPQITSTEALKVCVHNEASVVAVAGAAAPPSSSSGASILLGMSGMALAGISSSMAKTKPSGSSNIPVGASSSGSGAGSSSGSIGGGSSGGGGSGSGGGISSSSVVGAVAGAVAGSSLVSSLAGVGSGRSRHKNEIYVDIIEKLTVLFNAQGHIVNASIDGSIMIKSFLAGNPELRLALNENLVIGRDRVSGGYGALVLDDCNFHDSVRLDEFENSRTLHFLPPDGEFAVLNYRISTGDFRLPFRLNPAVDIVPGSHRMEFTCTVVANLPEGNNGLNVVIRIPVPRCTVSASAELQQAAEITHAGAASAEYQAQDKRMVWTVRKVRRKASQGGARAAYGHRRVTFPPC